MSTVSGSESGRGDARGVSSDVFAALDLPAALVAARAAWLGRRTNDDTPYISFTSLFLALAWNNDGVGRWIRGAASELGLDWARVFARWSTRHNMPLLTVHDLEELRGIAPTELAPDRDHAASPSAVQIGSAAAQLAEQVEVSTRHLFAAYLFGSDVHGDDYDAWGFDRDRWKRRFVQQIAVWRFDDPERWLKAAGLQNELSAGVGYLFRRAAAAKPPRTIDALTVFDAIVVEGSQYPTEEFISTWVFRRLGDARVLRSAERLGQVVGAPPGVDDGSPRELALDEDARAALTVAKLIGITGQSGQAHTRHVLAALLAAPSQALLDALGEDAAPTTLLAEIRARMAQESPDEHAAWSRVLDRHEGRMAGYATDRTAWPVGPDLLDIESDVNGLAAVIASKDVTPPLSIGLLGNWGTGKSFFIAKLRDRIMELARLGGAPGSAYHKEICHIEFNAWHYADVDLWASLATRIWDELASRVKLAELRDSFRAVTERRTELVQAAEAAERRSDEASTSLTAARNKEIDARATLEAAIQTAPEIVEARTRALQAIGLGPAQLDQLDRLRAQLNQIGGRLAVWWRKRTPADWLLALAVVGAVAAVAALWDQIGTLAGRLAGPLAALSALAVRIVKRVDSATAGFERALERTQQLQDSLRAPAVAKAQAAVAKASAEVEQTRAKLAETAREEARITAELARIEEAPDMRQLVLDRARSDDYRKHLGLISTIHRDFEDLSRALAQVKPATGTAKTAATQPATDAAAEAGAKQPATAAAKAATDRAANVTAKEDAIGNAANPAHDGAKTAVNDAATATAKQPATAAAKAAPKPCDRVVLYIDDLDRCPPRRVVEVLQAVHLLLSLELFVVIVAVDARWLLQSLEDYFARQFRTRRSEDNPHVDTPLHYLEKIFQIPLALKPVRNGGFGRMIESMVGAAAPEATPSTPSPSPSPSPAPPPSRGRGAYTGDRASPAPAAGTPATSARRPAPPSPAPRNLVLDPDEIRRLIVASDLMNSPRSAKRLVNLYRIVRAGVTDGELDDFVARAAGPTQLCLAIVVGKPALASELFTAIFERHCDSHAALLAFVRARAGAAELGDAEAQTADGRRARPQATQPQATQERPASPRPAAVQLAPSAQPAEDWRAVLGLLADPRFVDPTDWPALRDAAAHTARFSFQTSRVLQALGAARAPAAPPPAAS